MATDKKEEKSSSQGTNKNTTQEQRAAKRRISTSGIQSIKNTIEYLKPFELSPSQRLITYERMLLDPDVSTPFNKTKEMVEKAFSTYSITCNKHNPDSVKARDFMKWNIESYFSLNTTPRSVAGHAYSFAKNKLALSEKEFSKVTKGEWKGYWGLEGLYPVSLSTLDSLNPFKIENQGRKLSYARQRTTAFKDNLFCTANLPQTKDGFVHIPTTKLAMFTDSADPVNPFGLSVFDNIYEEWRFKTLVKEILLTGVAKDLSGTPVLYVPTDVVEEAEADLNSWQANFLSGLDDQAANLHNGDQTYIRLPSDPHDNASSLREYEIKFLGVEGGGKSFNLVEILEQSKKAIYNAFGAANLLAGETSGGSYNQLEGQNSLHAYTVERNVNLIEEVWNKDIWPQLFRLNEWDLSPEDMPKFKAGEITQVSLAEAGQFFNRVMRALPAVPEVVNHLLDLQGIDYQVDPNATPTEIREMLFAFEEESKVGTGEGSSGSGSDQQKNSDSNTENK